MGRALVLCQGAPFGIYERLQAKLIETETGLRGFIHLAAAVWRATFTFVIVVMP